MPGWSVVVQSWTGVAGYESRLAVGLCYCDTGMLLSRRQVVDEVNIALVAAMVTTSNECFLRIMYSILVIAYICGCKKDRKSVV